MHFLGNVALCFFVVVTAVFFLGVRYARHANQEDAYVTLHTRCINIALLALVAGVVSVRAFAWMKGGMRHDWLYFLHLSFVIPFAVLLILLRFKITGKSEYKAYHRPLAYMCLALYLGVLVTGFVVFLGLKN
ncbi:MAG: hypothetical protein AAB630_02085 [Patescibacteria group bacterium]